jgi:hypothetical protein
MRHVPPPLAALTAHAQTLSSAGQLAEARAVLADALDPADVDPQRASPDLANAAALLARILIALGDPYTARPWAGFAHAAEDRLYGPHDERTIAAAAMHARVLQSIGSHGRAAHLYHDLVRELTSRDGANSDRVLAAEADLAVAEHAAGQCTAARARLAEAWARHRRMHGDAAPGGIKMLARLGGMERECGLTAESEQHFALAQELCARYLPGDNPLVVQAARLAGAKPSGGHRCGRAGRPDGSDQASRAIPGTAADSPDPYRPGTWRPDRRPAQAPPPPRTAPAQPDPDERNTEPKGLYQQPLYLSDVHKAPGELTGRHARVDTPPPLPGQRAPQTGPDGREVQVGAVAVPPPTRVTPPDRRLPVPVDKPPPRGSWQPLVLVAMLVAGIAVAAAVVIATLPRANGGTTPPPVTTSSAPPSRSAPPATRPADAGAPPAGVRLRDSGDSVSLDWTYPKGAEGPVLISGGRKGQERRVFQQLPAGTTSYVVYGLSEQLDYCFTVAVVYTVDHVASSRPFCTARK